jgi:betaine lipid synthase
MGAGGDGTPVGTFLLRRNSWSFDRLKSLGDVKDDLLVLRHLWFSKPSGDDHAQRLESFYGPQAAACRCNSSSHSAQCAIVIDCLARNADDKFRSRFLWGRRPMLAASAARLQGKSNLVWVDLGGGTGVSYAAYMRANS